MVKKKGKSKRQTLKQKYKIEKRVTEHHRKLRKEAKRAEISGHGTQKKKKRDPGIPNQWPFKEDLLKQIERAKEAMEQRKENQKEERKQARKDALALRRGIADGSIPDAVDMPTMASEAQNRALAFEAAKEAKEKADADIGSSEKSAGQSSRRAFLRDLRKVIETSDVLLEVLDARDPEGSRALAAEEAVARHPNKRLILVLNKVDLVPKEAVAGWLARLRRSHPTVAFKACTQQSGASWQRGAPSNAAEATSDALARSGSLGGEALLGLLKNYCRSLDIKTSITVGVLGYPNTGKSSLINSLKRSRCVGTSAKAGCTRTLQEIQLDKHIKLVDSPGVVFDDSDSTVLKNCLDPDLIEDPIRAIDEILHRCPAAQLMALYALPRFKDTDSFLGLLARKFGKIRKGGIPDKDATARVVLRDWNAGKVKFYTVPPTDSSHLRGGASIVPSMSTETFSVDDTEVLASLDDDAEMDFVSMQAAPLSIQKKTVTALPVETMDEDEEDDDSGKHTKGIDPLAEERHVNPNMGVDARRAAKKLAKKRKKDARKFEKAVAAGDTMEEDGQDDYDFGVHYDR